MALNIIHDVVITWLCFLIDIGIMFQVGMNDSVSLQVRKKVNKELMLLISQLHIQVRENGKYTVKNLVLTAHQIWCYPICSICTLVLVLIAHHSFECVMHT